MPGSPPDSACSPPARALPVAPSQLGITCQLAQPPTFWGCYGNQTWRGSGGGSREEKVAITAEANVLSVPSA